MKIVVDGLMTEYVSSGKGKTVLFLHGWGSNAAAFSGLFKELKGKYRVVGLNFPGFGGSDAPHDVWDMQGYASFTRDFINKLGLKDVYAIVGHSFGGRVMLKGVGEDMLDADKLIFLNSSGVKPRVKVIHRLIRLGKPLAKLPGFDKAAAKLRSPDYAATTGVTREIFKKIIDEDLTKYMPKIKLPTLLVWGADDTETPLSDGKIFAEKIKNSKLEIIQSAGHYVFLDQPAKVTKLIKGFL